MKTVLDTMQEQARLEFKCGLCGNRNPNATDAELVQGVCCHCAKAIDRLNKESKQ